MVVPHVSVDEVVERINDEAPHWSARLQLTLAAVAAVTAAADLALDATHAQVLLWVPVIATGTIVWHRLGTAALLVLAVATGVLGMPYGASAGAVVFEAAGRTFALSTVVGAASWITRAGRELARRSRVDAATGLLNGAGFRAVLERERQRTLRTGRPLSVVYLDLDGLKQANDRFGHATGDAMLLRFARHLDRERRTVDVPARLGGDEFALLLPDTDARGTSEVLERFFREVGDDLSCPPVSAGAVTWESPPAVGDMISIADRAMYEVKRRGGSDWVVVDVDRRVTTQVTSNRRDETTAS